MSKSLKNLQNQFVDAIYSQENDAFLQLIRQSKIGKKESLNIYRNNVFGVLRNSLIITFPRASAKLERSFLDKFIKKYPSKSNNLDDYGKEFPKFLQESKRNFLSQLAELEWLRQKSYLAPNNSILNLEKLKKLKSNDLLKVRFSINSSVFLLRSDYDLLSKNAVGTKSKNKFYYLIYRLEGAILEEQISYDEYYFLNNVRKNLSLFEIYQKNEFDIASYLSKFINNQVLSSFYQK